MSRLSRSENANKVPYPGAGICFAFSALMTVINNAAIEGISSPMESVRNVATLALGGLAIFSFLKMRHNVEPAESQAVQESVQGFPSLAQQAGRLSPPIIEGAAAAMPSEDARWLAQTGQRPVSLEAEATRAASAALLNEGL